MPNNLPMDEGHKCPSAECFNQSPRLARVSPDLELVSMATHFVEVLHLVESKLLLPVISAVVVVE